jgi:hypothetical protein
VATNPITAETVVRQTSGALAAEVAGDLVLMSVEQGQYYGFDDIATEIWRRIEQPIVVRELCASLATAYDGDPVAIERDVLTLLDQLSEQNLVETVPA